ncbi:MAG: cytochrome c [Gammaproteobacteria bacterium]|jgi:cytochrome c553
MRKSQNYQRGLITSITLIIISLFVTNVQGEGNIEEGRQKARACQVCHGQGGKSSNPTYPRLAGQHAKYIVKQLKAFKAGTRKDPIMNGMASTLSLDDMEDVAAFFESNRSDNIAAK